MLTGRRPLGVLVLTAAIFLVGCRQDMHDQPKIEPLEGNAFFEDGQGSRNFPAGTVARGHLYDDDHLYAGKTFEGELLDALPAGMEPNREFLMRGKERYEIYCTVCHDRTGGGRGMIVRRGFKQPQPLYEQRLKDMPLGYYFDVMTNGFGVMSSYAGQVKVEDRWAIAAYLRVLQTSRSATLAELPQELQSEFHAALAGGEAAGHGGGHDDGHGDGHDDHTGHTTTDHYGEGSHHE